MAAQREEMPADWLARIAAELAETDDVDPQSRDRALQLYLKLRDQQGDAANAIVQFQIGRLSPDNHAFAFLESRQVQQPRVIFLGIGHVAIRGNDRLRRVHVEQIQGDDLGSQPRTTSARPSINYAS